MNQKELRVIRNSIARLKGNAATSKQVEAALQNRDLRMWLETWVIAPLELIAKPDRSRQDLELADDSSRLRLR